MSDPSRTRPARSGDPSAAAAPSRSSRRADASVHRAARSVAAVLDREGVRDQAVLVAVSGGSDSVALLLLASRVAPRLGLTLHVASIDHRLREESAREVETVRALAARFGASFHAAEADARGDDEDSLRRARLDALLRIADGAGCGFVLLGHTADDQVETIVFRFLRGAGFGGLSGMRERRDRFVRPLLGMRRETLRAMLRREGLDWVEDPTNATDRYARGRLRHGVLPAIEAAFGSGALDHLLDVAPRWRADEEFLEREASRLLAYASRRGRGGDELDREALASGDPALRSRALRLWIRGSAGTTPGSRQLAVVERWLDALQARENEGAGRVELPGFAIEHERGRLVLRRSAAVAKGDEIARTDGHSSDDDAAERTARRTATGPRRRQEAVLPPSGGRVRVRRK